MKKKFKQIFAALLVAVMLIGIAPVSGFTGLDFSTKASALESSGSCGENVTYTFDSETGLLTISGTGYMVNYCYDDSPFYGNSSIKSVIIENGVTNIGDYAFYECTGLVNITIPDSVTSIGDYVFYNCTSLTSIKIPDSVKSIAEYTFAWCESLASITIPNSVKSIGDGAFYECIGLKNITIPDSVTRIDDYVFYNCTGLTSITIPDSVASIGYHAFNGCTELTSIIVNSNNKAYDSRENCNAIIETSTNTLIQGCQNTIIPDSVTSISSCAFEDCTGLTSITIPDSVTSIGNYAFYNTGYYNNESNWDDEVLYIGNHLINARDSFSGSYIVKKGTKTIADSAFYNCTGLTSIIISDSVTNIGYEAFNNCTELTNVTIGNGVTSIVEHMFENCTELTSVTIGNSVTSVGRGAFYGCTGLESVIIGNSVKSIDSSAFYGCTGLTSIDLPDSVTNIDYCAFCECTGLTNIMIGNNVTSIGKDAFYETGYYNNDSNWVNDVLYIGNHLIGAKKSIVGSYKVKEGTKTIAGGAFKDCIGLTSITIPDNVTSIGGSAFYGCVELTSITIPDSVASIESYAFSGCTELTGITIPDTITSIAEGTFAYCTGLKKLSIPDTVKSIELSAFYDCTGLTSITIPESVTSIETNAFRGCTNLTNITIPDSVTYIGHYSFRDTGYYNDADNWEDNVLYINNHLLEANNQKISGEYTIKSGTKTVAGSAFYSCKITKVIVPSSVVTIGINAFKYCYELKNVSMAYGIKNIHYAAFIGCNNLKSVVIPESVTFIDYLSFGKAYDDDMCVVKYPNFKIYCYSGTAGEQYAVENGFDYEILSDTHTHKLSHIVIPATCTVNGMEYDICTECGETFNEKVLPMGHKLNHITVPATCKVAGMEYDICTECGETFNEKTLPLAAHTWGEWSVVKEPTTTAEGLEKRVCSVCGEEETRTIEKLKAIKDEKTGIEIVYDNEYDSDTEIKVEQKFDGESFQLINSAYGEVNSVIYDIATYKDGVKVQPDGTITVRVPLPEGFNSEKVFVCYVDSTNGKVTTIPCEVKDGYVTFETDHFSYYAILEKPAKVNSVSVSDISLNYKKSKTITPVIEADEGAEYTVTYESSNSSVARVDENGKVYAAKKGSAEITVTVTDSNGNTVQDTCKVNVKYSFGQWLIVILLFGWIWY